MPKNLMLVASSPKLSVVQAEMPSSASVRSLLEQIAVEGQKSDLQNQLMELREETREGFKDALCHNVLPRLLLAQHHRPCAAALVLRDFADSLLNIFDEADNSFAAVAAEWIILANGGANEGACDTGTRWRSCTFLLALLQAFAKSKVASLSSDSLDLIAEFLCTHVQDRSSDVRCAAVEALDAMPLRAIMDRDIGPNALFAITGRALQDCDAHVRAAAVHAVVSAADVAPKDIFERISLDCASRVRRALLLGIEMKIREGKAAWSSAWPPVVLGALKDYSHSVRAKAKQCLLLGTARGWLSPLLEDTKIAGQMSGHLGAAASELLTRHPELERLRDQLSPESALQRVSDGRDASLASAILAHVALVATVETEDALNASAAIPALMAALSHGRALEVQQLLLAMLEIDMPPNTTARLDVAKAAIAVLLKTPMRDATEMLLSQSALSAHLLGGRAEVPPHNINLAMLALRRFADSSSSHGSDAGKVEARFSQAANSAMHHMLEELRVAEEDAWRLESEKTELASAARITHQDCYLRVLLTATAWLQESRVAPFRDNLQKQMLEDIFRPALSCQTVGHSVHVAALKGIGVYASKCKETALSHWPFFLGLLSAQWKRLKHPASSSIAESAPLCVVARFSEIAVLFLSDTLLLYGDGLGVSAMQEALLEFARLFLALDLGAPEVRGMADLRRHLIQVRNVLCDRICSLAVMGKIPSSTIAGSWLLAMLLSDVCGPGAGEAGQPEDDWSQVSRVVGCSRILRFFSMLPNLSIMHAELLVVTLETFFGARLWMDIPSSRGGATRNSPPVRASRFICLQLKAAADAASSAAVRNYRSDSELDAHRQHVGANVCAALVSTFTALKVRAVRAIAASILVAPQGSATMLRNALAAAVLTFASGGQPFDWAAGEAKELGDAVANLLGSSWKLANHPKAVEALVEAIQSRSVPEGAGEEWSRDALDNSSDIRHELATLGLLGPHFDFKAASRKKKSEAPAVGASVARPACLPSLDAQSAVEFQLHNADSGEAIQLPIHGEITIGRHSGNDVVLSLASVSGKHCSISCTRFGLELVDLGASNGTYINGRRLQPGSRIGIKVGDSIAISGQQGPRFEIQRKVASASMASAAMPQTHLAEERHMELSRVEDHRDIGQSALKVQTLAPQCRDASQCGGQPSNATEQLAQRIVEALGSQRVIGKGLLEISTGCTKLRFDDTLADNAVFTIGRSGDCDITVSDPLISARHCILVCRNGIISLEDTSANGTYINDERVPKSRSAPQQVPLHHGDRIALAQRDGHAYFFYSAAQLQ